MEWFRSYHRDLDNRVLMHVLSGDEFRGWYQLCCVASAHTPRGTLPDVDDLAFALRCETGAVYDLLERLMAPAIGLVVAEDGVLWLAGWREQQFAAEGSTERVRKYRQRKADALKAAEAEGICNVSGNVSGNVSAAPPPPAPPKSKPRAASKKEPVRDRLFEAVVGVCYGKSWEHLTATERSRVNAATAELRRLNPPATPEQVYARGREYRARDLDYALAPQTLCKQWTDLGTTRRARGGGGANQGGFITPERIKELSDQYGFVISSPDREEPDDESASPDPERDRHGAQPATGPAAGLAGAGALAGPDPARAPDGRQRAGARPPATGDPAGGDSGRIVSITRELVGPAGAAEHAAGARAERARGAN